jgi:hypothetical protein
MLQHSKNAHAHIQVVIHWWMLDKSTISPYTVWVFIAGAVHMVRYILLEGLAKHSPRTAATNSVRPECTT